MYGAKWWCRTTMLTYRCVEPPLAWQEITLSETTGGLRLKHTDLLLYSNRLCLACWCKLSQCSCPREHYLPSFWWEKYWKTRMNAWSSRRLMYHVSDDTWWCCSVLHSVRKEVLVRLPETSFLNWVGNGNQMLLVPLVIQAETIFVASACSTTTGGPLNELQPWSLQKGSTLSRG